MMENKARQQYDIQTRQLARDLYVHRGMSVKEISGVLGVPTGTLGKWQSADDWVQDSVKVNQSDDPGESFAMTCEYLMRTIHYMSRRLFLSMFQVGDDQGELILPDEKLELRINRLTLALERIMPMGSLLRIKQRVETIKELKQTCFDALGRGIIDEHDMKAVSRVVDFFLVSLSEEKTEKGEVA